MNSLRAEINTLVGLLRRQQAAQKGRQQSRSELSFLRVLG
jgi:hypothetical protein